MLDTETRTAIRPGAAGRGRRLPWWRDQRGAVAALLGLLVVPLFIVLGLAIDGARAYLLKAKLQQAIDAAGLAGGQALGTGDPDEAIQMYFDANYPGDFLGGQIDAFDVTIDQTAGTVTVDATATIPTAFMRVAGIPDVTVNARTVIQRANTGIELALVLDDTGSMQANGKIGALKNAAHELLQILYGNNNTLDNLWVAVVPYRGAVNVGSQHTDWLTGYDPAAFAPDSWAGCVEARAAPHDQGDLPPSSEPLVALLWPSGPGNRGRRLTARAGPIGAVPRPGSCRSPPIAPPSTPGSTRSTPPVAAAPRPGSG